MSSRAEKRVRKEAHAAAWREASRRLESGNRDEALRLLDSPWSSVRSEAVRALRTNGQTREVLPELIEQAAREEDDSVRLSIALALRDVEDPRAAETLWAMVERDPKGAGAGMPALQGLSRLGDERVVPIAVSWYRSRGRGLKERAMPHVAVFDLVLLQSSSGDRAVDDLLSSETSWRRRRLIRRARRRAERWLATHG
jgi:HEAT repeats